jgi:TP901 family phage tail tape measure protein
MPIITNSLELDAVDALSTLNRVQAAFLQYNRTVGQVVEQSAAATKAGKEAVVTFTQIDSAGRKTATTVKEVGNSYAIMNTKVTAASAAQRRLAADLETQKNLADQLASSLRTGAGVTAPTREAPTTLPGADPAQAGTLANAFARLTKEQFTASLTANRFTQDQITGLEKVYDRAQNAIGAFKTVSGVVDSFGAKLNEVGKIAFATAVYRGISLIQLGLTEGIKTAGEYSRQIGLIQTLATTGTDTFGTWSVAIRAVADEFGRPVTEVAQATYDALSNQIIKTTDDMNKLTVATELARNTNTGVTDSVNVLSSVLNTFGTSAGSAQQISDKLFKTVDLGRVRINELNGVIGRSGSITKTAHASFDELAGGLIVLTQTGLQSAEAATLMNNLFSQLVKPNKELSDQLARMGFESGPAAIQVLGLAGVMEALHTELKKTGESIAKFFPEMRGMRSGATFADEGIRRLLISLKALEESAGTNAKATATLNENVGQKLSDEVNRIKNFFTVDLGQGALTAVARFTQSWGGLANVIKNVTGLFIAAAAALAVFATVKTIVVFGNTVKELAIGFTLVATNIGIANAELIIFGRTLAITKAGVSTFLGAFGVGLAIGEVLFASLDTFSKRAAEKLNELFNKNVAQSRAAAEREASDRTVAFEKSVDNMTRSYGRFVARIKAANFEILKNLNTAADDISDRFDNVSQVFTNVSGAKLKKYQAEQEKGIHFIGELQKSQLQLIDAAEQAAFERLMARYHEVEAFQKGAGARAAIKAVEQRNLLLEKQHKIALDNSNLDEARRLTEEIIGNLDRLNQFNVKGINAATGQEIQKLINLENAKRDQIVANTVPIANAIVKEKLAVKDLADTLRDITVFTTKTVQLKEGGLAAQYVGDPKKAFFDLEKLKDKADREIDALTLKTRDPLNLQQLRAAREELNSIFISQKENLFELLKTYSQDQAATKFGEARIKQATELKELNAILTKQLLEHQNLYASNTQLVLTYATQIQNQSKKLPSLREMFSMPNQGFVLNQPEIESLANQIKKLITVSNDIPAAKAKYQELLQLTRRQAPDLKTADPIDPNTLITYTQLAERIGVALNFMEQEQNKIAATNAQIGTMNEHLKGLVTEMNDFIATADPALKIILDKENSVIANTAGISENARAWNNLALSIAATAKAAENLSILPSPVLRPPAIGGVPEARAGGGVAGSQGGFLANFFGGKYARGTDIIPTMLGKGEFVVRAPMAERYYSQLLAMNSGTFRTPLYKSQGGSTTNNNDYHFTVQGNSSAKMAREIMGHINRAQKQGTGRIS